MDDQVMPRGHDDPVMAGEQGLQDRRHAVAASCSSTHEVQPQEGSH